MFKRLSLRQQVISSFALLLVLTACSNFYLINSQSEVLKHLDSLYSDDFAQVKNDAKITADSWQADNDVRELVNSDNAADEKQLQDEINSLNADVNTNVAAAKAKASPDELQYLNDFSKNWAITNTGWADAIKQSGNNSAATAKIATTNDEFDVAMDALQKDSDSNNASADATKSLADKSAKTSETVSYGLMFVLVLLGGGLALALSGTVRGALNRVSRRLGHDADQLQSVSVALGAGATQAATQSQVVAAAAEEMSVNMSAVAAAIEEMQATVQEIASTTSESSSVAQSAVSAATSANVRIEKLGTSSQEIGKVIDVITSIAEQTNLLALNATIEAARAGEAGKGFAVVANEVKELAKETSKATEEIGNRVAQIQGDTLEAVAAITQISAVISRISDMQQTVAIAVEEQTATTAEIARNVNEAAAGSGEVARNISGVASAAEETAAGAKSTQDVAASLAGSVESLKEVVSGARGETSHESSPRPVVTSNHVQQPRRDFSGAPSNPDVVDEVAVATSGKYRIEG